VLALLVGVPHPMTPLSIMRGFSKFAQWLGWWSADDQSDAESDKVGAVEADHEKETNPKITVEEITITGSTGGKDGE
jgi:hypothetical protein